MATKVVKRSVNVTNGQVNCRKSSNVITAIHYNQVTDCGQSIQYSIFPSHHHFNEMKNNHGKQQILSGNGQQCGIKQPIN